MPSIIEICNSALGKAGISDQIMNIDTEKSVNAMWCRTQYPISRDAVLRDFPWRFATKTISLGMLDEKLADGKSLFLYPADCLNVLSVSNGGVQNFEIELIGTGDNMRKVIVTDGTHIDIKYTVRVTDPNLFDSLFVVSLAWHMAGEMVLSVGGNNTQRAQYAAQQYEYSKSKAQRASIAESREDPYINNEFMKARG